MEKICLSKTLPPNLWISTIVTTWWKQKLIKVQKEKQILIQNSTPRSMNFTKMLKDSETWNPGVNVSVGKKVYPKIRSFLSLNWDLLKHLSKKLGMFDIRN